MKAGTLAAALLLTSAAAPGGQASLPENATNCIDLSRVLGPEITQQGTILYRQNRIRTWRALTTGACPGLDRDVRLAVFPFQGQRLCRGDRFRILYPQSSVPGAVCRFGGFVPVDRAPSR